jgi:hypothetical protein
MNGRKTVTLLVMVLLAGIAATASARTAGRPYRPSRKLDIVPYVKNQWRIMVSNYGTIGYNPDRSGGGEWPVGSGDMYLYGAGIWIGTVKRVPAADTLVSVGYNPNSGRSEMTPGCYDNAPGGYAAREFERVYIYPDDWPPNRADFPADLSDSVLTPLRIPSGDSTIPGYFYYIPQAAVSSGDAWAIFNDRDPAQHTAAASGTPRPIGFEVYQTTYSWTLPWNRDIVFFKLDIRNRTSDTIRDVYLGIACDADVGNATDDRAALALAKYVYNQSGTDSVWVDNMGYVWSEGIQTDPSGFVGFDFLQSPYVKNPDGSIDGFDGLDNNGNGLIDEPAEGRQYGMSAFKIFTLTDADPVDDFQQYLALAGYDYWNPQHPYNPYDSTDVSPADKRFLQSTGPFSLAPNEIVTVTFGAIAAERAPGTGDQMIYHLAQASRAAQAAYDNNWIAPEPPPSPHVTAVPGDGRVTLVWDDFPEDVEDRFFPLAPSLASPFYVGVDFQGYKVYRSRTGQPNSWTLLDQFDRADGLRFEDTTVVESLRTNAQDRGLAYAFVDSSSLRLGFPYYYAVTAFDLNYVGGDSANPPDTLSLESGIMPVRTVPRTQAGNYTPPGAGVTKISGHNRLQMSVTPLPLVPEAVKQETYRVQFLEQVYDPTGQQPLYRYFVTNAGGDTVVPLAQFGVDIAAVTDTTTAVPTIFDWVITNIVERTTNEGVVTDTTRAWLPVAQVTLKLKMDQVPNQFFQNVKVVTGSYPESTITVGDIATNRGLWAYRGSDYRVIWTSRGNALTVEVWDVQNNLPVPFKPYYRQTNPSPDTANGWAFRSARAAVDTFVATTGLEKTIAMAICGSYFTFSNSVTTPPAAGDTWLVYSRLLAPAPCFAAWDVEFTPGAFGTEAAELDVKVVPNPYIVRNEWERHPDFRRLKFINLPDHCTIRIYNLAGDLVRTLEHSATRSDLGSLPNQYGGDEDWDLLNESQQKPSPGVYIFHIESDVGTQVGKFMLVF